MRAIRVALLAVAAATLLILARPASADCPPEDPACRLFPAQSVEVHADPEWARGTLDTVPEPGSLTTVPIPNFFVAAIPLDAPAPAVPKLDVPLRLQDPSDVSCGVQALGMALAGLDGAAPASSALLGMLQGSGMMYAFGTGVEELAYAAQTFGYRGSLAFHDWDLADLRAQLDAGHPVVVALGANGEGAAGHFVTVTGISADGEWVADSDPAAGERVVPVGEFLAQWGRQGNSGVIVGREAPSTPAGKMDLFPWVAFAAALMALVSTTPLVTWRQGIGGKVDSGGGGGKSKSKSSSSSSTKSSKTSSSSSSQSSSSKSSSSSASSSSKSSSKSSEPAKAAAAPVVLEDIHREMKDLKGIAAAGSASSASTSKPVSTPPAAAPKGLEKVKEVELPPAAVAGKVQPNASPPPTTPAQVAPVLLVELADPRNDPLLTKGAPMGTVAVTPVKIPAASVTGSLDARLEKVKDVEVLGTIVGSGAPASTGLVDDLRDLKPKASVGSPAAPIAAPKTVTADERLRQKIEDVYVGKAVEDQKNLVAELTKAVTFKIAGPNSLSPVRPPWISSMDWNHMPLEDRQAVVTWEVQMILSGMAPFVSQGAQAVDQAKGNFIDWVHKVVLPGCSGNPAQIPTAQELSWIYAKNSPGGELAQYLWVCASYPNGAPGGRFLRGEPCRDGQRIRDTALPYMSVVRWTGEVYRSADGLLWYKVTYRDSTANELSGWLADHDQDGVEGLAPYRASDKGWEFGDRETPLPLDPRVRTYGYGEGTAGWDAYLASGETVAQYIDLKQVMSSIGVAGAFPTRAVEQCAFLAVGDATGVSLEEVYRAFLDIKVVWDGQANDGKGGYKSTREILEDDEPLEHTQVKDLLEALGYSAKIATNDDSTLSALAKELQAGKLAIPLVTINSSGTLDPDGTTAHWVRVQAIDEGATGVAIYNPFQNLRDPSPQQGTPAEAFGQAWAKTPGNRSSNAVVLAWLE